MTYKILLLMLICSGSIYGQTQQPPPDPPAAFDKIIASETANLTEVFKEAGI